MAARRNRHGRRRNRGRFGFLYKLLSVLLIVAAILTGCVVFFRVDEVLVVGQSRYTQEEIVAASGVEQGDNLFLINKLELVERVLARLPYVDELTISRKLPDTLVLSVTECVPVAVIQANGAYWLMDAKCKLLEQGDISLARGQAQILGLTALGPTVGVGLAAEEEQKLSSLRALLQALNAEQMMGSVKSFIDLTADNEIRFSYGENLTVVFPMITDEFSKYVYRLKLTLWEMDDRATARSGTLDLTYDNEAHLFPERWLPEGLEEVPQAPVQTQDPAQGQDGAQAQDPAQSQTPAAQPQEPVQAAPPSAAQPSSAPGGET